MSTTIDPTRTSTSITLSNGNLTTAFDGSPPDGQENVYRAVNGVKAGQKCQWEGFWNSLENNGNTGWGIIGFCDSRHPSYQWVGRGPYGIGIVNDNNRVQWNGNRLFIFLNPTAAGTRYHFAVDRVNNRFWCAVDDEYWNASATADPEKNIGGVDIGSLVGDIYPAGTLGAGQDKFTHRFLPSSWTRPALAGFTEVNPARATAYVIA